MTQSRHYTAMATPTATLPAARRDASTTTATGDVLTLYNIGPLKTIFIPPAECYKQCYGLVTYGEELRYCVLYESVCEPSWGSQQDCNAVDA
jgi:hypothetical protein